MGGMRLGMGVASKGLMNPLDDRFTYAWVKVIPWLEIMVSFLWVG